MTLRRELGDLVRATRLLLESERDAGLAVLPHDPVEPIVAAAPQPAPAARPGATPAPATAPEPRTAGVVRPADGPRSVGRPPPAFVPRVRALALAADALEPFGDLPDRVASCTRCPLCADRTLTVFGEGSASARLVFCGEGPGYEEDRSGRPFVGRAGELLSAMIEKGMKLRREDVFVLNAIKCRPPNNRTPAPDEVAACRPYLEEQLRVIAPDVIVALGNPASRALLGDVPGITRIRGQVFEAFDSRVVPTFHPAYLLRNPAAKADAWKDLQLVLRLLAEG